jgi:tetratricopeptide (TPR) repeat protein
MARRTSADLVDAERFFVKAIDLDPEFALAYVGLADTLGLQIDYGGIPAGEALERAGAAVARALALDPDLAEGATSSAWLAFQSGDFAEAEAGFHRAIELNPNYATAYHWSSRLFGAQGRYEEALRYAERAVLLDPLSVIINVNFGISLERVSRFEDALAAYHRAIEIEPSMPNSYLRIGALHDFAFGRLDLAMPWFEKAARIDPGNPDYSMALAGLYLDLGDDTQARLWLEETLRRSASYSPVYAVTALLQLYDGKQARMLSAATKAVEIEPRNSLALRLLRDYDLQRGDYAKIRERYASAFPELLEPAAPQVDATNYSAAVDLAPVLHETGEHELADALLARSETLLRGTPRMGWMGYRITDSQIYALRGRQGEALAALRAAGQAGWRFLWRYHRDHDPSFASIRGEPAFRSIFADIEADMARQRAELAARPADAPLAPVQPPAPQPPGF